MSSRVPQKAIQILGIIKKGIEDKKNSYTTIQAYGGRLAGILCEAEIPKGWSRP